MTIKEMEEKCGMSRTNIRFYESEGLIAPKRRENGYRVYSQEDADVLMKVKLLRLMDVPLDTVKEVVAGTMELEQALDALDAELDRREQRQERTRQILDRMKQEGDGFEALEPERYLPMLESGEALWKEDASPRLNLPWRRYWARCLDYAIYLLAVDRVMALFPYWSELEQFLPLVLMLLAEPLLLSFFGTTPGKVIFGIRVLSPEERRLTYGEALSRTWTVMWEGEALRIPLISEYFQYKALTAVENDETLSWEWDSELTFKDDKLWRYAVYFPVLIAVEALYVWLNMGGG